MELGAVLGPESRVIDVGVRDPELARRLAAQGHDRYLGLAVGGRLAALQRQEDALQSRFHPLTSTSQVERNSADVLILRRPFVRWLWSVRDLKHVRYLAVEREHGIRGAERHVALLADRLAGRVTNRGRHSCGADSFDVFELAGRRAPSPRRYLSPVWGVAGFIERLQDAGLNYVALRWFDGLPVLEPGEDLDLLVADQDLDKVQNLLAEEPGTIPIDLYSESGLPGSDYHGVAYYPPALAKQLLERAELHVSGCRVPSAPDYLTSLAYHAVYHKGGRSGLPSELLAHQMTDPEHDYASALATAARAVGVGLPPSLEGIDEHLAKTGWRPPLDTLLRLTPSNPWIKARFFSREQRPLDPPEMAVFLLREQAAAVVTIEDILKLLDHRGFEIVLVKDLDSTARERCAAGTRGGNWSRGPFPRSGGLPATVIVTLHHGPRAITARLRAQYPRLSNRDVLMAKRSVRDLVTARLDPAEHFNPVHSSDNELEAWEYVNLALPEEAEELRAEVSRRRAAYRTEVPVVGELSRGRRAKVEIVEGPQGLVVRKTFANGYQRHMRREVEALRELGPYVEAVPELIDTGPNWFTIPYFENELRNLRPGWRLVPLGVVRDMVMVLRQVHARGVNLIDVRPQNFLLDPRWGLKLVDFEFLYRYPGQPPDFADSYIFRGLPPDFPGDRPVGGLSYDRDWRRYTGLSRDALVNAPAWSQHVQRTLYRVRWAVMGRGGPGRSLARGARQQVRERRRDVALRYRRWARVNAERTARHLR